MFVSSKTAEYPVPLDYIAVFGNYKEHALQVYCTVLQDLKIIPGQHC